MLKAMRKHAKFFYVLFFIVILSFIFWGVGTVDKSATVALVEAGSEKVTLEEYWASYDRAREFYRNITKGAFTEEAEKQLNLKQKVLDLLIDEVVLMADAKKRGIKVSDEELREAIVNDPAFLREGRFSEDVYLRVLQLNRMTPEYFEFTKRKELTLSKIHRMIGEAVNVPAGDMPDEQAMNALLSQMRQQAVKSYVEGLKQQMKIKVNQQLIS
jgi:parvulin-like peptidyl-prolyl isomerase